MIGNFYPFLVAAAVIAGFGTAVNNPVNVRSTSAATEILNDEDWLVAG